MVTHLCPFQQARYTRNCNISAGNSTQSGGTRLHPQAATVAVLGDLRFVPIGVFLPAPNALATLAYLRHTHRHRQTTTMHTSGLVPCTRLVDGPCPDRATGGYLVGVLFRLKPGSLARRTDRHSITIGQGRKKTQKLVGVGARDNHSERAPNNHTTCSQTCLGVQQPASHTTSPPQGPQPKLQVRLSRADCVCQNSGQKLQKRLV